MKHGWGLKLLGTCFAARRRFNPIGVCTAYVTFENSTVSTLRNDNTQWYNLTPVPEAKYDRTIFGSAYNRRYMPSTSFPDYYFDTSDVNSWNMRGYGGFPPLYALEFTGPKYKNTLAVIPLTKHTINPIENLKVGRLGYNFLDANATDIGSALVDPLEYVGVYPYTPQDGVTVQMPGGWMYSNTNVDQPYLTESTYEGSGSSIDRTTALTTQLNYLPFVDPLRVYNASDVLAGQFDGLAFTLFYGELAFKLPFNDLPEYEGLIADPATDPAVAMDPTVQMIGLEINIFLAGSGIPSPRIGRLRWWLPNRGNLNDPTYNYFTTCFEHGLTTSYIMPMSFRIRPSQGGGTQSRNLPLSNLKVTVGA